MKMSEIIQQLPSNPMTNPIRRSLEASIEQFGDQEVSMEKAREIEAQVKTFYDQFQLKH
jgi:hypothetical protein